jgi:hypothetical protein
VRILFAAVLIGAVIPAVTSAQQASQTAPAAFNEQQQSKLSAWAGTWQCTPVRGGATETSATSLQGHYYVTRYTGAHSLTAYSRWDTSDSVYYVARILDAGGVEIFKSASPDPANGVWVGVFPENIKGQSIETTLHGSRMTWGDMKNFGIDCRKQ